MKKIIIFFLSSTIVFATSLQKLPSTFTDSNKKLFLQTSVNLTSKIYPSSVYKLQKGWNQLITPIYGINIQKTFNSLTEIEMVVTFDKVSKLWAVYPKNKMLANTLFLKYLEPHNIFFVLTKKNITIKIISNIANNTCNEFLNNNKYNTISDSGIDQSYATSKIKDISFQSRYFSHHDRGIYNDTRQLLIYPKVRNKSQKLEFTYGSANPKMALRYTKENEGKKFYIYDYKQQKCFMGIFPSIRIPPFPMLKELN